MGWETLTPPKKQAPATPVRLGLRKAPKGRARMTLIVEHELLEKLPGGGRVTIQIGTGAEAHQLRIVGDKAGLFECTASGKTGRYVRFTLPPIERFPDKQVDVATAAFNLDKTAGALIVDLPSWAWLKRAA